MTNVKKNPKIFKKLMMIIQATDDDMKMIL